MRDLDRFLEIPLCFSESSNSFSGTPLTAIACGEGSSEQSGAVAASKKKKVMQE